jgi:hypothetical protein
MPMNSCLTADVAQVLAANKLWPRASAAERRPPATAPEGLVAGLVISEKAGERESFRGRWDSAKPRARFEARRLMTVHHRAR